MIETAIDRLPTIRLVALAAGGLLALLSGCAIVPVATVWAPANFKMTDALQPRIDPEAQRKADEEWRAIWARAGALGRPGTEEPPPAPSPSPAEMAPAAPPQEATAPVQQIPDFGEVLGPPAPPASSAPRRRKL